MIKKGDIIRIVHNSRNVPEDQLNKEHLVNDTFKRRYSTTRKIYVTLNGQQEWFYECDVIKANTRIGKAKKRLIQNA